MLSTSSHKGKWWKRGSSNTAAGNKEEEQQLAADSHADQGGSPSAGGFLGVLKRLSSTTGQYAAGPNPLVQTSAAYPVTKTTYNGHRPGELSRQPQCPRVTLNVNRSRPRVRVAGIDNIRLNRVGFKMDNDCRPKIDIINPEVDFEIGDSSKSMLDTETPTLDLPQGDDCLLTSHSLCDVYKACSKARETPTVPEIFNRLKEIEKSCNAGRPARLTSAVALEFSPRHAINTMDLSGLVLNTTDELRALSDFLTHTIATAGINELNLGHSNLTPERLNVLLSALRSGEVASDGKGVRILNLQGCEMITGPDGWSYLASYLNTATCLKSLNISGLPMTSESACVLCDAISKPATSSDAEKSSMHLQELIMKDADMTFSILRHFCCLCSNGLMYLSLDGNGLPCKSLQHLLEIVASSESSIRALSLSNTDLSGDGLKPFIQHLEKGEWQNKHFVALSLNQCELYKNHSLHTFLERLANLPNLRFLNLGGNQLFKARESKECILRCLPTYLLLTILILDNSEMTANGLFEFAQILPDLKQLVHLNLLQNPLHQKDLEKRNSPPQSSEIPDTDDQRNANLWGIIAFVSAVRVSTRIAYVEIDFQEPSPSVQALERKILTYCIRNMVNIFFACKFD